MTDLLRTGEHSSKLASSKSYHAPEGAEGDDVTMPTEALTCSDLVCSEQLEPPVEELVDRIPGSSSSASRKNGPDGDSGSPCKVFMCHHAAGYNTGITAGFGSFDASASG